MGFRWVLGTYGLEGCYEGWGCLEEGIGASAELAIPLGFSWYLKFGKVVKRMCGLGVGASLVQLASALAVIDGDVTFILVTGPFFSCFPPSTSSDCYYRCRYPDSLKFYKKNVDTSGFRRWAVELLNYGKSAEEMENGWTTFAQRDISHQVQHSKNTLSP